MKRWEIRRHIQETRPFDMLSFVTVILEKFTERGVITDAELMQLLRDQATLQDNVHYE